MFSGGLDRDRTGDLTDANRTLSQLSYEPVRVFIIRPGCGNVKISLDPMLSLCSASQADFGAVTQAYNVLPVLI